MEKWESYLPSSGLPPEVHRLLLCRRQKGGSCFSSCVCMFFFCVCARLSSLFNKYRLAGKENER